MKYLFEGLIIAGILILIAVIIKNPKDAGRLVLDILLLPFRRMWSFIRLLLIPIELLILYLEKKFGVDYLTKFLDRGASSSREKTKE